MWWRRFKRKQRFRRKKQITYLFLLALMFSMSLGYAVLNTSLNISGISSLANAKWDIHFDNIVVKEGSVTPTTEPIITDDTTVTFSVILENPGDYYEFNIDVVNAGTINAMIDEVSISPVLTDAQQKYLDYIVTYEDGVSLVENQRLNAGDSETLRIAFIYKEGDPDDYPDEDEDIPIEVSITYVQEDEDAEDVNHPPKLYNILKDAAEEGTYAKEYTGSHKDYFTQNPSNKIYHWYADSDTNGTTIQNKNNVVFAGHCWQMIRTTDTGGVKMLYNGEAEDGKCLDTRGTHVGYGSGTILFLNSSYWYGTDYTYDSTTKKFKISGATEQAIWNETTASDLVGKYTCKLTSEDDSCSTIYLVGPANDAYSTSVMTLTSNSNYSQFGNLDFNSKYNSPSYVGYMYNTVYPYNFKAAYTESVLSSFSLSSSYWYADSVTWGNPVANRYNLNNPYQVNVTTDYQNLVGKYTFRNENQTFTNSGVYYIAGVDNTKTMYYIWLSNSDNHTLSDFDYIYTYGDSYTDNGDGTYTINNPATIKRSDWYTRYGNVGANKYVCKNAVNNTCRDLWYSTSTSNISMTYIKVANNYKYAKGFTWDGSKYVLDNDTSVTFWNLNDSTNRTSLNNAHYTCWNTTGECTTISYVFNLATSSPITLYYINISNGKSVEDAINEMLYNNDVNTVDSKIKRGVDAWYKHYLLKDYDDYIEDTIFCNDRSQKNADTNGWNPNGGSVTLNMTFKDTSDLSCVNITDQFSVSNNSAKLKYKVGLISSSEMNILNNSNARKAGHYYWLASPYRALGSSSAVNYVSADGSMRYDFVNYDHGVRPAISLKPGITYSTGDGSMANPYVVSTN